MISRVRRCRPTHGLHVLGAAHGQGSADATVTRITAVLGWAKANRSVLALTLPPGFPEKYAGAIRRAVDQCAVKKHMFEPPAFEMTVN